MSKRQPHAALVTETLIRLRAAGWFAVPITNRGVNPGRGWFSGGCYKGIADVLAWRGPVWHGVRETGPDTVGDSGKCAQSLAAECKHGNDKLKPDQLRFKRDFEAHGGQFIEVRNPEADLAPWTNERR
jgi:hypothetical protein